MNYQTNDLLYGFLRGLSTARPIENQNEWQEYLPKKTFKKNKKLLLGNIIPYEISEMEVQDIDTQTDWEIAEMKYRILNFR